MSASIAVTSEWALLAARVLPSMSSRVLSRTFCCCWRGEAWLPLPGCPAAEPAGSGQPLAGIASASVTIWSVSATFSIGWIVSQDANPLNPKNDLCQVIFCYSAGDVPTATSLSGALSAYRGKGGGQDEEPGSWFLRGGKGSQEKVGPNDLGRGHPHCPAL